MPIEELILQQFSKLYMLTLKLEIELRESANLGSTSLQEQKNLSALFDIAIRLNRVLEHKDILSVKSILIENESELINSGHFPSKENIISYTLEAIEEFQKSETRSVNINLETQRKSNTFRKTLTAGAYSLNQMNKKGSRIYIPMPKNKDILSNCR